MNPIDADRFYAFLKDQKVKETGAFSKGVNKGLNIAMSALKNKEITLPWEVDRVKHGEWIKTDDPIVEAIFECSVCGEAFCLVEGNPEENLYRYCPNCGAKMEG